MYVQPHEIQDGKKQKCFGYAARVLTPQGYREIQDLKPLDTIYSWSEANKKLVINYVANVYRFDPQAVKRMVSTPTGRAFKVTADHPFYLPSERRYVAIRESRRASGAEQADFLKYVGEFQSPQRRRR